MRKKHLLVSMLSCAAALAQTAVAPPAMGSVRDASGNLHAVVGVAGNFILADTGISNVVSAAFSASAGLIKTDTEVLVLDGANRVTSRSDAPAGPALFAFDSTGAPALVYYSGTLLRFDNGQLVTVPWTGDIVSIAMAGPRSASAIVRRDGRLWNVRVGLLDGGVEGEVLIQDVSGPVFQVSEGGLLFTRDGNIVLRDASGVERIVAAGFQVDFFEPMGTEWIAIREAAGGRLFALRITPRNVDLYQLPEATQ